ncbi:MAG: helix-turn-helix transcriptional regulator [Bacteroidales bacterium]
MKQKFQEESVNKRIMLIMREKNLNKNSLSKLLGISQPALKKIESNVNLPSFKLLFELLSNFQDINPEWLITGNGKMYRAEEEKTLSKSTLVSSDLLEEAQRQSKELINMLKQSQVQVDNLMKMYSDLVSKQAPGNDAHLDSGVKCAGAK